jgi:hypothetical protein
VAASVSVFVLGIAFALKTKVIVAVVKDYETVATASGWLQPITVAVATIPYTDRD